MITRRRYMGGHNRGTYLTIEALQDLQFRFSSAIEYKVEGGSWQSLSANTYSPTIAEGKTVELRGLLTPSTNGIGTLATTSYYNISGNPMSLIVGDYYNSVRDISAYPRAFYGLFRDSTTLISADRLYMAYDRLSDYCCVNMFNGCTQLRDCPSLPSMQIGVGAYISMYYACTSLTVAKPLPATTLTDNCYTNMFSECSNLIYAPTLPALTLRTGCYQRLFYNCVLINEIEMLATDISASSCMAEWVRGVSSAGIFKKNSQATWSVVGDSGIPSGWTVKLV